MSFISELIAKYFVDHLTRTDSCDNIITRTLLSCVFVVYHTQVFRVNMIYEKSVRVFKNVEIEVSSMAFKERLKEARTNKGLTQAQLAKEVNMTARTIQNYELGSRKPQKFEVVERLAAALDVTSESLISNSDMLIIDAHEKGGSKSAREVKDLVSEVTGLFAGGEIDDSEKDEIIEALNFAYWDAKKKNKKYTPKKYQK